jgi:DNA-binding transcriptional MerR regulator
MSAALSIGRAAEAAGVTTRTLRYYEQLGLLAATARSVGGARRYSADDLERVARIRQLQGLLGQDLEQVRRVLAAEDRLAELRAEWDADADRAHRATILAEATDINNSLRAQVQAKVAALADFATELEEKAARYRQVAEELDAEDARRA